MIDDDDAIHAARAILGGERINLSSEEVFAILARNPRISSKEKHEAKRMFDAMQIGVAVEAVERADGRRERLSALLRLARVLAPHLKDRRPGWFRFMSRLGSQRGESMFDVLP